VVCVVVSRPVVSGPETEPDETDGADIHGRSGSRLAESTGVVGSRLVDDVAGLGIVVRRPVGEDGNGARHTPHKTLWVWWGACRAMETAVITKPLISSHTLQRDCRFGLEEMAGECLPSKLEEDKDGPRLTLFGVVAIKLL
jgi:hypothetical protein